MTTPTQAEREIAKKILMSSAKVAYPSLKSIQISTDEVEDKIAQALAEARSHKPTLNEWSEAHAKELRDEIACHIRNTCDSVEPSELNDALRCIMISIRQWATRGGDI